MSEPVRMRSVAPALDAALDDARLDPPAGMEDVVWSRLEAALAAGTSAAEPQRAPRAEAGASSTSIGKALMLGGALAVAVVGGALAFRSGPTHEIPASVPLGPISAPVTALRPATPDPLPAVSIDMLPPAEPAAAPAAPAVRNVASAPSHVPAHPGSADLLTIEIAGVLDARARVRAGDGAGALAQLEALDTQVPVGTMREERESLRIEALVLSGQSDAARAAASRFAEAHPASPHLSRVRRLTKSSQ